MYPQGPWGILFNPKKLSLTKSVCNANSSSSDKWATIIFGGKLRYTYFRHKVKKGMHQLGQGQGSKIGLKKNWRKVK